MPKKLEGKIALITGGSRGIGAAIAKRLAADGANVAITYTKGADAAASVVKEIERAGRKAIAIQADAADADAVKAAVEKTVTTFGRLDILVHHAGGTGPPDGHQRPRRIRRDAGGAKAHEERWSHHLHRLGRGRARPDSWPRALLGYKGSGQDVHSRLVQRSGEPGHHRQQRAAGSDRYGYESRHG